MSFCFVVAPQTRIDDSHGSADRGFNTGFVGKSVVESRFGVLQDFFHRDRPALGNIRVRRREEFVREKFQYCCGVVASRFRTVQRGGCPPLGLPHVNATRREHNRANRQQHGGRRHERRVPPRPFHDAFAPGRSPGANRLVSQEPPQVVGKLLRRGITRLRFLGQRLDQNRLQVPRNGRIQTGAVAEDPR